MDRREFLKSIGISVGALSLFGMSKRREVVTIWRHPSGAVVRMTETRITGYPGYQGRVLELPILWNHDPAAMIKPSDLDWISNDNRALERLSLYFRKGGSL